MRLQLQIPIKEGLEQVSGYKDAADYVENVLDVYIKGTPFKRREIWELHQKIVPHEVSTYKKRTIQEALQILWDQGKIKPLDDGFSHPGEYVFGFMKYYESSG